MEEKTFEKFVEYAKQQFGYRVYKTSPETALVVGNFKIEEPIEEPDYSNKIKTTQLEDVGDGVKKCAVCGYTYNGTPRSISCIGCGRFFSKENFK